LLTVALKDTDSTVEVGNSNNTQVKFASGEIERMFLWASAIVEDDTNYNIKACFMANLTIKMLSDTVYDEVTKLARVQTKWKVNMKVIKKGSNTTVWVAKESMLMCTEICKINVVYLFITHNRNIEIPTFLFSI
jgi:hypothetical protein